MKRFKNICVYTKLFFDNKILLKFFANIFLFVLKYHFYKTLLPHNGQRKPRY